MGLERLCDDEGFAAVFGLHHPAILAATRLSFGGGASGSYFGAEHAAGERAVGHHAEAEMMARRRCSISRVRFIAL